MRLFHQLQEFFICNTRRDSACPTFVKLLGRFSRGSYPCVTHHCGWMVGQKLASSSWLYDGGCLINTCRCGRPLKMLSVRQESHTSWYLLRADIHWQMICDHYYRYGIHSRDDGVVPAGRKRFASTRSRAVSPRTLLQGCQL